MNWLDHYSEEAHALAYALIMTDADCGPLAAENDPEEEADDAEPG